MKGGELSRPKNHENSFVPTFSPPTQRCPPEGAQGGRKNKCKHAMIDISAQIDSTFISMH
jgi:hypothetical protein